MTAVLSNFCLVILYLSHDMWDGNINVEYQKHWRDVVQTLSVSNAHFTLTSK